MISAPFCPRGRTLCPRTGTISPLYSSPVSRVAGVKRRDGRNTQKPSGDCRERGPDGLGPSPGPDSPGLPASPHPPPPPPRPAPKARPAPSSRVGASGALKSRAPQSPGVRGRGPARRPANRPESGNGPSGAEWGGRAGERRLQGVPDAAPHPPSFPVGKARGRQTEPPRRRGRHSPAAAARHGGAGRRRRRHFPISRQRRPPARAGPGRACALPPPARTKRRAREGARPPRPR